MSPRAQCHSPLRGRKASHIALLFFTGPLHVRAGCQVEPDINGAVILPSTTSHLGNGAFQSCSTLKSISMPSVTWIGTNAFEGCTSLTSVSMPAISSVGAQIFLGCSSLGPSNVTSSSYLNISQETWPVYNCDGVSTFDAPESLTSIYYDAFRGCHQLTAISLPAVTSIPWQAFLGSSLVSASFPAAQHVDSRAFAHSLSLKSIFLPSVQSVGAQIFQYCSSLSPSNVTMPLFNVVSKWPFLNCDGVRTFESHETIIQFGAFARCFTLNSVSLPAALSIENRAFESCSALTSVSIPAVQGVGTQIFKGCSSLSPSNVNASVHLILASLDLQITEQTWPLFNCDSASTFEAPDTIAAIPARAFDQCSSLSSVSLPAVTFISDYSFQSCISLTSISMPLMDYIARSAFWGCSSLRSVSLPAVSAIADYSFHSCTSLTNISMPHVDYIGFRAFADCTSLRVVELPHDCQVEQDAFYGTAGYRFLPYDIDGCTSQSAINFNSLATGDDGTCVYSSPSIFPSPPPLPPITNLFSSYDEVLETSTHVVESATASSFDPSLPPSNCAGTRVGYGCRIVGANDTWLQLNLYQSSELLAFYIEAVGDSINPGLLEFEVWLSNTYDQDYLNASQRCYAGIAPTEFTTMYQHCRGDGRFVRLRLLGQLRTLTLAKFLALSAQPFPSFTQTNVSLLHALPRNDIQQAVFKSGESADACVDGDSDTPCGFDDFACNWTVTYDTSLPAMTLARACATYPQLSDSCDRIFGSVRCQQPATTEPYLDIRLSTPQRLLFIGLRAPPARAEFGHYKLMSGPSQFALSACTFPEGVASDVGDLFVRECNQSAATLVRILLPGLNRKLRLLEVTLYVDLEGVSPPNQPPLPPAAPPPPATFITVERDGNLSHVLRAALLEHAGQPLHLLIHGSHLLELTDESLLASTDLWLEGDGDTELLAPDPRQSLLRFSGKLNGADSLLSAHVRLSRMTVRGHVHIGGDSVTIDISESMFLSAGYTSMVALNVSAGRVELWRCVFDSLPAGAIAISGGTVIAMECSLLRNRALVGGAVLATGGVLDMRYCRLESNTADLRGGAFEVVGGSVILGNQTLMSNNYAPLASSAFIGTSGSLRYILPAPLGHWITVDSAAGEATLASQLLDGEYPLPCPPGSFGSSLNSVEQTRPVCSGLCPKGFLCSGSAARPVVCPVAAYCPSGAALPRPCTAGTYSNETGLSLSSQCNSTVPGFFSPIGSIQPLACSPGTFAPFARSARCTVCSEGTYQDSQGQTGCKACPKDLFCPRGASLPLPCPEGMRLDLSGSVSNGSSCVECGVGVFCTVGSTEETPCTAGTFNDKVRQKECAKCAAGKFQDAEGQTACKPCERGSFCREGAAASLPCLQGTFGNNTNLESPGDCSISAPGFYSPTGSLAPTECAAGSFASSARRGKCTSCPAGSFQEEVGATQCKPCTQGSFCLEGASAPIACPDGHFGNRSSLTSAGECALCPAGYSCSSGSKLPCAAGSYSKRNGQVACKLCSAGKYQNTTGSSKCMGCPAGYYSPNILSCLPCPVGEYCGEGAITGTTCEYAHSTTRGIAKGKSDCVCKVGYYMDRTHTCQSCSEVSNGIDCSQLGEALETIKLLPGYWRSHNQSEIVRPCFTPDACLGAAGSDATSHEWVCAEGHQGPFCDSCKEDYHKDVGGLCKRCGGNYTSALILPIIILVLFLCSGCWFVLRQDINGMNDMADKIASIAERVDQAEDFNQATMGVIKEAGSTEAIKAVKSQASRLGSFLGVTTKAKEQDTTAKDGSASTSFKQRVAEGCVSAGFFVLFLVYPSTSQTIFFAFQCLSLDDGQSLLRVDMSISCDSNLHRAAMGYAMAMILVYPLGVPWLYFKMLRKHKTKLWELQLLEREIEVSKQRREQLVTTVASRLIDSTMAEQLDEEICELKKHMTMKRALLPDYAQKLVGGFQFRVYWFELAECLRKLLLVGAPVFFDPPGSVQQLIYGMMVCFLIFGISSYFQPYADRSDGMLSILCQAQIFFALLTSIINSFDGATLNENHNIGVLLVILTCLPMVLALISETPLVKLFDGIELPCLSGFQQKKTSERASNQKDLQATPAKLKGKFWFAINPRSLGSKLRILIGLVQVLHPLGVVYDIPYPSVYTSMLRYLSLFELNFIEVTPMACIYHVDYHKILLARTLLPIAILLAIFILYKLCSNKKAQLAAVIVKHAISGSKSNDAPESSSRAMQGAGVHLFDVGGSGM